MKGQAFLPDHMEIAAGTTVTWKNLDALIHTVTAVDKTFLATEIFVTAAAIYLAMSLPLGYLTRRAEARVGRGRR